jgi:hypothetical protein
MSGGFEEDLPHESRSASVMYDLAHQRLSDTRPICRKSIGQHNRGLGYTVS